MYSFIFVDCVSAQFCVLTVVIFYFNYVTFGLFLYLYYHISPFFTIWICMHSFVCEDSKMIVFNPETKSLPGSGFCFNACELHSLEAGERLLRKSLHFLGRKVAGNPDLGKHTRNLIETSSCYRNKH